MKRTDATLIIYAFALTLISFVYQQFNMVLEGPYMDEIFHIPQAKQYCQGNWDDYDPKLTTPPGLYIVSYFMVFILSKLKNVDTHTICISPVLRSTNMLFCMGLLWLFMKIIGHKRQEDSVTNASRALTLLIFPPAFFFHFLYYTDSGSVFFVLWSFYLSLKKRYFCSALISSISLLFRQNNIIWVIFIAGSSCKDVVLSLKACEEEYNSLCKRPAQVKSIQELVKFILDWVKASFFNFFSIVHQLWAFFIPLVAFTLFVIWNEGIVLGDRSNHIVAFHVPQFYYFMVFTVCFTFPMNGVTEKFQRLLVDVLDLLKSPKKLMFTLFSIMIISLSVHYFTMEHPFILSDNRHYTFYIWKRFFRIHPFAKFVYTPIYLISFLTLYQTLAKTSDIISVLLYFVCTCFVLIPTPLLEIRYYILPFYFFCLLTFTANEKDTMKRSKKTEDEAERSSSSLSKGKLKSSAYRRNREISNKETQKTQDLNSGHDLWTGVPVILCSFLYVSVNVVVIYLFLYQPFEWLMNPFEKQRFMW